MRSARRIVGGLGFGCGKQRFHFAIAGDTRQGSRVRDAAARRWDRRHGVLVDQKP